MNKRHKDITIKINDDGSVVANSDGVSVSINRSDTVCVNAQLAVNAIVAVDRSSHLCNEDPRKSETYEKNNRHESTEDQGNARAAGKAEHDGVQA